MTQQYNAAYTEGAVCAGGVLKSVFTKDRACGHLSFRRGWHCLTLKNHEGSHRQIASVLHVPSRCGKGACLEGSPTSIPHVSVAGCCACICVFLSFLLRFSLTVSGTMHASKALNIEAVNLSQTLRWERTPNPLLKDHLLRHPTIWKCFLECRGMKHILFL